MAWLVQLTVEPRYSPGISVPEAHKRFFSDLSSRMKYESIAYDQAKAPTRAFYTSGGKTIPDFTAIFGRFSVCQEARVLVEAFEPGVHQFLPMEIVRPRSGRPIHRLDGRVLDTPYSVFNIMTVLDAVWVEKSRVRVFEVAGALPLVSLGPSSPTTLNEPIHGVTLRREMTQGHHIWRGGRHLTGSMFFSDVFMEAVRARGLRKLEAHYVKEA